MNGVMTAWSVGALELNESVGKTALGRRTSSVKEPG